MLCTVIWILDQSTLKTVAAAFIPLYQFCQTLDFGYLNDNSEGAARNRLLIDLPPGTTNYAQVNTAKAEAELAYSLQAAKVQAKIKEEEMQVKVVEREQNIRIQEQEIMR